MQAAQGNIAQDALLEAVGALRETLDRVALPLDLDGAAKARATLSSVVAQLDDYVIPRLRDVEAPLLAVVGGSTGAGKSTLLNSLIRVPVSVTGVLRPTTRSPVLVHNPADTDWFAADRVLPGLPRTTGAGGEPGGLHLIESDAVPVGLALLDAPDLDSVVTTNRDLARQLLAAADLWLFVTSAARYADAVPWESLRLAGERGTAIGVVLDRVPAAGADEVTRHFAQMLAARELGEAPLFVVPEQRLGTEGMLDVETVEPILGWLGDLAVDAASRAEVARRSVGGAITSLSKRVAVVAAQSDDQAVIIAGLRTDLDDAYGVALEGVDDASQDGSLLRGEVLARWHEFVGTGQLMRGLEQRLGKVRDRLRRPAPVEVVAGADVSDALRSGLETLVVENADVAADLVWESWRTRAGGAQVRAIAAADLSRASRELRASAAEEIRGWQRGVLELVRAEGADKRATARFLSLSVNGVGVVLMVVVFAHTGGLTGAEVGIAGGTGVVGQRVLEAVFGDQAVRNLTKAARADLRSRVERVLDIDAARFGAILDAVSVDPTTGPDLRTVLRRVEGAR